VSPKKWNNM